MEEERIRSRRLVQLFWSWWAREVPVGKHLKLGEVITILYLVYLNLHTTLGMLYIWCLTFVLVLYKLRWIFYLKVEVSSE
jgi:hypothetical protein